MDQTTITVLGMIAAFITASVTAFLAEPVKMYFQDRSSRKYLTLALYKELLHNYFLLEHVLDYSEEDSGISRDTMNILGEFNLRTECYRQAVSDQLQMFYRLEEAAEFNEVYSMLALAIQLPSMPGRESEDGTAEERTSSRLIARASRDFINSVARYFYSGKFNKVVLARLVSTTKYVRIMNRGQYVTQQITHPSAEEDAGEQGATSE